MITTDIVKLTLPILMIVSLLTAETLHAQLERRPVVDDRPVDLTFLAPRSINLHTVEALGSGELHFSVMHNFGEVSTGIDNFWGLDSGANVRLSLEYGFTDRFSLGISRTRVNKVVDITGKAAVLQQTTSGSTPLSVSVVPAIGINTTNYSFLQNEYSFADRISYALSVPVARKFNEKLSLQVSPMIAYFNRTGPEVSIADPNTSTWYSAGISGRYMVSSRTALAVQYIPPLTDAENHTYNFAVGVDIDTGGHVFQMFFSTSPALNDQYILSSRNGSFPDREFRLGFNVNRLFSIR